MKRAKLSKVLALVLACAMIFTTLPLMVFADEAESYTVSYGSPSIPMNENTTVDLSFINVEMDAEGTLAKGSEIVWDVPQQGGLFFNKAAGKVAVSAAGRYKLTATANGVTKTVWIIAKKATDDKFYLVNMTDLRYEFVNDNWRIFDNKNATNLTVSQAISESKLLFGKTEAGVNYVQIQPKLGEKSVGGTLVYVDEIFKDFADYTVETYTAAKGFPTSNAVEYGSGAVGRVTLNEAGTGFTTGIMAYLRQNEQISINRDAAGDFGGFGTAVAKGDGWRLWSNVDDFYTVKNVYEGSRVLFYLNDGTGDRLMLDSSTNANYPHNALTGAGYLGVMSYGTPARFNSFSVYLNSSKLAPTTTISYYDAMGDYTSPPMGLVAAYNAASCKKSIELRQYREHGTTKTATNFDMRRVSEP